MHIPALRVLLVWRRHKPSKKQTVLNTKWLPIFMTGFSINFNTTICSNGLRQKALSRAGLGHVKPMNQRMRNYFPPQV